MRKKILCLLLTAVLSIGLGTTAYADEFSGSSAWSVEFDGKKMNSNFKSSEMTEEIYQLQPGDTIKLQVSLKNAGSKETDWYMTNEVLKSLEESQKVAEGGAYTYRLTYVDHNKQETVLYTSDTVGGEGDSKAGKGLNQATNSLDEYFYLDRLATGGKGTVYLTVGLDGETQGNEYQDTLAQLQMNFAVEEVEATTPNRSGSTPGTPVQPEASGRSLPRTGDETDIIPYCVGALFSGIILLIFGLLALRDRQDKRRVRA